MSRKRIPPPRKHLLLGQLWLLKGRVPLHQFVNEFNEWRIGIMKSKKITQYPEKTEFSYHTIQSWLRDKRMPLKRDLMMIRRKISWLRTARPYRARILIGMQTAEVAPFKTDPVKWGDQLPLLKNQFDERAKALLENREKQFITVVTEKRKKKNMKPL